MPPIRAAKQDQSAVAFGVDGPRRRIARSVARREISRSRLKVPPPLPPLRRGLADTSRFCDTLASWVAIARNEVVCSHFSPAVPTCIARVARSIEGGLGMTLELR